MTVNVVGFEGQVDSSFHITWGAAATKVGDRLLNTVTGLSVVDEWGANIGDLERFEAIEADADPSEALTVIAVNSQSKFRSHLLSESSTAIAKAQRGGLLISVVRNPQGFDLYRKEIVQGVFRWLSNSNDPEYSLDLTRAALALDPHSPWLNAFRVHLSPRPDSVEKIARACLRGDTDVKIFDKMLGALRYKAV